MEKKVKILKALANEKRLAILRLLEKNPNLSVIQIAKEIDLHFKSTSKHLQKLSEADLIKNTRDGIWVRFKPTAKVDRLLKDIGSF